MPGAFDGPGGRRLISLLLTIIFSVITINSVIVMQARLHVADDEAAAGLQSLAHLMARVAGD